MTPVVAAVTSPRLPLRAQRLHRPYAPEVQLRGSGAPPRKHKIHGE